MSELSSSKKWHSQFSSLNPSLHMYLREICLTLSRVASMLWYPDRGDQGQEQELAFKKLQAFSENLIHSCVL